MYKIGAQYLGGNRCTFVVWAPLLENLSLHIVSGNTRRLPLEKDNYGYFHLFADKINPGDRYLFRLNNKIERPDPASYFQPDDIFEASCVIDHSSFQWNDHAWKGIPLEKKIIYELHVGTFTKDGTFDAVISKLPHLLDLGINAIEIMPVAQFPGKRNWGYDGVYPFAVQNSYGGPDGLKRLVNACHTQNISVILDVVYNHLGPEGNFLPEFMPCLTDKYKTPWGNAINLDHSYSNGVRNFFIQNALYWFEHFHIDALRLDAIHGIFDMSAKHFLKELSEETANFSQLNGRKHYLIAESDLNDVRTIEPYSKGGYNIDAQWNDDYHHCLHTLLTKENHGYYEDFTSIRHLAKAIADGFVYSWEYSAYRKKYHGSSASDIPASRLVVFSQNHDQTGNRMKGERLSQLISFEALKIAAGLVILSANIPLLFMGEEYGEEAPFLFFVNFHDIQLSKVVKEGRKKDFASFLWNKEPDDPSDENTFLKSKLKWDKIQEKNSGTLFSFYKKLIQIRKDNPILCSPDKNTPDVKCDEDKKIISIIHKNKENSIYIVVNFNETNMSYKPLEINGYWSKIIDSSDTQWLGLGSKASETISRESLLVLEPISLALYKRNS